MSAGRANLNGRFEVKLSREGEQVASRFTAQGPRMPMRLRTWQREALDSYLATSPRDWLVCATPGAGKTTFTLAVAAHLWQDHVINRVIVVCPTDHLRSQWIAAARGLGLDSVSYTHLRAHET